MKFLEEYKKLIEENSSKMGKDAVKEYFSQLKKGSHAGRKFAFIPESYTFKLLELRDRKTPRNKDHGWWGNFGMRIL